MIKIYKLSDILSDESKVRGLVTKAGHGKQIQRASHIETLSKFVDAYDYTIEQNVKSYRVKNKIASK